MAGSNHLGRFIRECRASLGYTSRKVEELSRTRPGLTPISHSNLLAIEKGTYIPTIDKVLTLAALFNVPTQQFEERIRRDMFGRPLGEAPAHAGYDGLTAAAAAAREAGQHARSLELETQALALALAEDPGADGRAGRIAGTKLQVANCRMRLGLLRVAKEDLEEVLASDDTPAAVAVRANYTLAEIYRQLRNSRLALLHARSALDLATEAGETVLRAKTLNLLANVLDDRGDPAAVATYREAMDVFATLGDERAVGLVARNLGTTCWRRGDAVTAAEHLERGLAIARESGDRRGTAFGLVNLARARELGGDLSRARDLAREAKEIATAENYPDALFASIYCLYRVARAEGQLPLARVYGERLSSLHRKLEARFDEAEEWAREVASGQAGPA